MSIFSFILFILHFAVCCLTGKSADVTLDCPGTWRNNCRTTVSCRLQTANFTSAVCSDFGNKTRFLFRKHGATSPFPECTVDFSQCTGTYNTEGCACTSHDKDGYTFEHNLVTSEKLKNGSWFCEPLCFDANLDFALSTNEDLTCSSITVLYFIIEWRGIALLCVGEALVIFGIIVIVDLADRLGIARIVGIAVGCVGYILLIAGSALMTVAYIDDEPAGIAFLWVGCILLITHGIGISIAGQGLQRDFVVLEKVGTGLMWVGGTLAIIGGIVATTERCPSDEFPTTLQEILGLVFAVIGFVVFVVGIIIGIVALH